jgi:uncharacterized protein YqeY
MLVDDMKRRMLAAMKAKKPVEKEILGVALGEIQTADARGTPLGDEGALAIVRKLVKSNEETLGVTTNEADKAKLLEELVVLRSLLPQTLDVAGITAALEGVRDALRAAGNDGQATGWR